ncbi:MAG TPA: P-II family nitrogen regulator [Haloplasmataceae bacterium]
MENITVNHELIVAIVDFGKGSKIYKLAKNYGVSGATFFLGHGTVNNYILKLLDLTDVRKEIVMMLAKKENAYQAIEAISKKFHFDKPNHGIAFTVSIEDIFGVRNVDKVVKENKKRSQEKKMYNAIFVVADKGKADNIITSAVNAGSKGATVINGRGSGIHEQKVLFNFPIEPEKDIVLIITEKEITNNVTTAIRNDLKIDEPGMGIMFVIDINEAYGLY